MTDSSPAGEEGHVTSDAPVEVDVIEAFAKSLKAYYAAEKGLIANPSQQTLALYMDAMEHFYTLRDHAIAVARVRKAHTAMEVADMVERLMAKAEGIRQ